MAAVEMMLDQFCKSTYGCPFEDLSDRDSRRVLGAFAHYVEELMGPHLSPGIET